MTKTDNKGKNTTILLFLYLLAFDKIKLEV